MTEIHAVVSAHVTHYEQQKAEKWRRTQREAFSPELEVPCHFIAEWTVNSSTDWGHGFSEIDSIDFVGEGKIIPMQTAPVTEPPR